MKATIMDIHELPAILTVEQFQRFTGTSREIAYRTVHRKDFPKVFFGRTIRIPKDAMLDWFQRQSTGGEGDR